jgi:hydrophobe/amphiphile efflux-1 (HAE1) family protein
MSISAPFIKRPIATSLLMAAIALVGIAAYPLLPVSPLPEVDFPTIQVQAQLPGASPETMAATVAQPLETEFAQIPSVSQMTSVSVLGTTQVTLQFQLNRNIDAAAQDVQAAINAAQGQLPQDLPSPPTYRKIDPSDAPIMILGAQSDTLPLITVDDDAETMLAQHISQLPGVGEVLVGGQHKPAVRVQVDPARLAAMGLTLEDVRSVLASATVDDPKGSLDGPHTTYTLYDNDQMTHAAEFNNVVLAYRNGAPVRVRDIGEAVDGPQNALLAGWNNGKPGIQLIVFKLPGANVIQTSDAVKAALPQLEAAMPASIKVTTMQDRTLTIRAALASVQSTLLIAICLVVMVIFLFLRNVWATIIPSLAVPLALIGTFAVMYLLNFSLDNLSLMALTIAVGFVVDDAIVMLENIYRHVEEGMQPMEAALKGAGEIGFTIISISLSLIAVFIPLLLMGGIVGRLFREFAMTVAIAVVVSAVVSLTLTPMLCSRFLKPVHQHGRLYHIVEAGFNAMIGFYRRTLDIVLRHQPITLMVFFITMGLTVFLYIAIPKGFFPEQDNGLIQGISEAAQNVSFEEMSARQQAINKIIGADPNVQNYACSIGAGIGGQTENNGRCFITLKPFSERKLSAQQIIAQLRPQLAKVEGANLFLQANQDIRVGGRLSKTEYQYTIQDADTDELYSWAPRILKALSALPMLRDVTSDQQNSGVTATLQINRDRAAQYGIQPALIDNTLDDAFGQREIAQYFSQVSSYYLILEVPHAERGDLTTLNKLYVRGTNGIVPLSTFVSLNTTPVAPLAVNHQGQFPAVTISFNLARGAAIGDAVNGITAAMAQMGAPQTLSGTFQGTAQAFQSSLSSEPYLVAAALITVYIILGMLYESYILPLAILSTLPSAGVGALLMLILFRNDLTVIALIGVLLLIGIVKKNGIMMVDFAITAERKQGLAPLQAIRQACLLRFRPILMTTMAALLSGLPLMLASGAGSELRKPLGIAMVGGLILSQMLTLYTTPVVYLYLDRLQHWLAPRRVAKLPTLASKMGAAAE